MPAPAPANLDFKALTPQHDDEFFTANPKAAEHLTRFESADRHHDMQRQITHNTTQELREDIVVERERAANENDPTKKANHLSKVTKMRAEQERLVAQKSAPTFAATLRRFASNNRNNSFVPLDWTKFFNGGSYKDARKTLYNELAALADIEEANRSTEEAQNDFRNGHWANLQRQGIVEFHTLLKGGSYNADGKYIPRTVSRVLWPEEALPATFNLDVDGVAVTGGITVNLMPAFAIMAWLDGDNGPLLTKFLAKIAEANEGRPSIPMAEKPALLAAQAAKVLQSRRELEAIITHHEMKEPPEYLPRIPGTPPEVLLWLERAPANATAPAPAPNPNGKASTLMDLKEVAEDDFG